MQRTLWLLLVVFLILGVGAAAYGLASEPAGMLGNLVAEFSGVFFGAAAIDLLVLVVQRVEDERRRLEEQRAAEREDALHAAAVALAVTRDPIEARLLVL